MLNKALEFLKLHIIMDLALGGRVKSPRLGKERLTTKTLLAIFSFLIRFG